MKKAAIKVSANLFQEMLKLPFGVAIEDVIYNRHEEEFTVVIFGDRMPEEAETKAGFMKIANYEISPLWHKGRITLTDEMIEWPKDKVETQTTPVDVAPPGESEVKENGDEQDKETKEEQPGKKQPARRKKSSR